MGRSERGRQSAAANSIVLNTLRNADISVVIFLISYYILYWRFIRPWQVPLISGKVRDVCVNRFCFYTEAANLQKTHMVTMPTNTHKYINYIMLFYIESLLHISTILEGNLRELHFKGWIYRDITILVLYIRVLVHKLISIYPSFATHLAVDGLKIDRNM